MKATGFRFWCPLQVLVPEGQWNGVVLDLMWVEAFPVPNMEVETVAEVVTRELICRFGTPRALHLDKGHTF